MSTTCAQLEVSCGVSGHVDCNLRSGASCNGRHRATDAIPVLQQGAHIVERTRMSLESWIWFNVTLAGAWLKIVDMGSDDFGTSMQRCREDEEVFRYRDVGSIP